MADVSLATGEPRKQRILDDGGRCKDTAPIMFGILSDSREYLDRKVTPFSPPKATIVQVRACIPKNLYERSTATGLYYVIRDITFAIAFYGAATYIDPWTRALTSMHGYDPFLCKAFKWSLWSVYWFWQGIALAGWWCLGHEAGHENLSPLRWINHCVGFSLHTFLLVPFYSWRSSHRAHHKATGWVERDENYVPRTRSDCQLPPPERARFTDYHEMFEETPIYTLGRMFLMQLLGWQYYLLTNALGSPMYPAGTNHFSPSSPLFRPEERENIIISDIGLLTMLGVLSLYASKFGLASLIKFYLVPYLLANHWIVMLTFLHHTDPTIPHYRTREWTFLRGALAAVDRPLLGSLGRFFLHNVSHDHIAHHIFSNIPFYNQPLVTEYLKTVLNEDYNYDSTSSFRALYRAFTECLFIEDDGDIVFYKNKNGVAQRILKTECLVGAQAQ